MPAPSTAKAEVTRLLKEWRHGRSGALDQLMPLVYDELRRMARLQLGREASRGRQSLQATELVHEAFIRLVDQRAEWQNRLHFYGIAASCMRRILIDHARKKHAAKRPPPGSAVDLENAPAAAGGNDTLLALDEALTLLAKHNPRQAQVAELKLFGGLEITEIAQVTGVSVATVKRDWADAKKSFSAAV